MTREDQLTSYDTSLPQAWFDNCLKITGLSPHSNIVWCYDKPSTIFGRPISINHIGDWILARLDLLEGRLTFPSIHAEAYFLMEVLYGVAMRIANADPEERQRIEDVLSKLKWVTNEPGYRPWPEAKIENGQLGCPECGTAIKELVEDGYGRYFAVMSADPTEGLVLRDAQTSFSDTGVGEMFAVCPKLHHLNVPAVHIDYE